MALSTERLVRKASLSLLPRRNRQAVQIHGGYCYIKDFPVERYLRNSWLCEIGGGTSEIQNRIIAKELINNMRLTTE
jgi:alkylation response protein AidB-like acyl-CoA dehydrogenase